ncbi:MAG: polyribonucleotide nucleotidyltransferase [Candidatus Levybacteria bacterium RIFOXYA1_FULL_41_10]|nr:MAG: Polyribonucleotide nucleotidyltransferase [Candidatus Levybacteria bacterium GW2011_GWA1_39_32]KKR51430.1 MAG: Polyribonucleotide nucleotidyltransferase [Candidatus Levybacteria bacterium GW2011_GWC1_40_19]KKR73233.1 MAG: Polyribonucleotide nucleotidyltransferase [Candidatus Levybacteria bacterium GW2011_GWC2_40_7]KKR94872.1 MAG: Polyribonucleotide nucleotidyltransferase [Candidatus Levybacteria bacterium GW2011_GWA2_41_15]KKS00874.1 MAG: Polyribonucleotide nucleotidyltransferase [Candi
MKKTQASLELAGKTLTLEMGELARLATSSVLARLGDTMVLATVVMGQERDDIDYFPLTVEYVERLYAGGRIKGSRWVKREGRPSDDAILSGRLIDRSIRPLFPKSFKREVQVVVTILSVDNVNDPDTLSIVATSAALHMSPIPWGGPVGAVRVAVVKEKGNGNTEFIINPEISETQLSDLDLVVTQTKDKTLMIEAGANQVSEDKALEAIEKAQAENVKIIEFIENLAKEAGIKKEAAPEDPRLAELTSKLEKSYKEDIEALIKIRVDKESGKDLSTDALIDRIYQDEKLSDPENAPDKKKTSKALETVLYKIIKSNTLKGKRVDGRGMDEVRPISSKVSVLPRTHGSAIFQRGDTQVLTVATLGSPRMEQLIESAEGEEAKSYIHHYSFPPYSVGETGRMGVPSRREIGHGALAERALEPVIPIQESFPYTIRVVSEVLSSNGSTSMASTCGSTLALMDAGVPIKSPVSGVAMGMMSDGDKYQILTDILGLEDFAGDMDFKVAGTKEGVTAIQLDVKIPGLTLAQIKEILEKAKVAREGIMDTMLSVIPTVRQGVSEYAPKIELIHIPVEKIGEVIGPGGRMIKSIIAQTGATVDVEDDGTVTVSGTNEESVRMASEWIAGLVREVKAGEVFEGEVKRILPFGAFVEILPGKEGMVHVSQMASEFVKNPNDVVAIGDKVKVKVIEIDEQSRINLSMKFGQEGSGAGGGDRPEKGNEKEVPALQQPKSAHPLAMQFQRERREKEESMRRANPRRTPYKKNNY